MVVVNEVYGAGDGNMGVQTAACQPAQRRADHQPARIQAHHAKERAGSEIPVDVDTDCKDCAASRCKKDLDFDSFFTHILAHEINPWTGSASDQSGWQGIDLRQDLKDAYATIEEAKADITGLWALSYMMQQGQLQDRLGRVKRQSASYLVRSLRPVSARCILA